MDFAQNIKHYFGIEILPIFRDYDKGLALLTSVYNELVSTSRKIIETAISVFTASLNASSTKAPSISFF